MGMLWILLVYVHICILNILSAKGSLELIFFATPGGRGLSAGFYGGRVDLNNNGYPKNIHKIGYDCMGLESSDVDDLMVKSVSQDLASGAVIVNIGSTMTSSKVTLLRVPLCARLSSTSCDPSVMLSPIFLNIQINTHKIAAFASYGDKIYFISETTEPGYKRIELRNLTGCGGDVTMPYRANSAFYIERCSTVVATLVSEDYDTISNAQYYTTSGLAIVSTATGPVFYTQIQHFPPKNNYIISTSLTKAFILMRVSTNGEKQMIHEEYVKDDIKQYVIQGLGQITYRNRLLCWTALDRIVCAKIDDRGTIYHARTIMKSGDAMGICEASTREPFLSTVTTGIAIAKAPKDINRHEVVLYFGCIAQTRGLGGSGLVRKKGNLATKVQLLRSNFTTIYAGSMLVSESCSGGDIPPSFLLNTGVKCDAFTSLFPLSVLLAYLNSRL